MESRGVEEQCGPEYKQLPHNWNMIGYHYFV